MLSFGNDADYIRFGVEVGKLGYNQIERTLPQGVPGPGGSVAYRYRIGEGDLNTLYQLGFGVFTTNGLPPYASWSTFRSVLENGILALNNTHSLADKSEVWCIVRYMDFFTEKHLGGMTREEFFTNSVGLRYQPLAAFGEFSGQEAQSSMRFFVSIKDGAGREIALDVGEGSAQDQDGIVMNTSVTSQAILNPSVDSVMACFDELQAAAHNVFFEMIRRDDRLASNLPNGS